MKLKNYQTSRYNDFWWGMNVRDSLDSIEDKQFSYLSNFSTEGNKLKTIKWYEPIINKWSGWIKWIASWSKYIAYIYGSSLYVYDTTTNSDIASIAITSAANYNISVGKVIDTFICITSTLWDIDAQLFRFNWTTITSQAFTSLTNKKFVASQFMKNRLFLGWNQTYPSTVYSSKIGSPTAESNIYDFTFSVGTETCIETIWDVSPVTWFLDNNWEQYIFKTNWVYNISSYKEFTATTNAWFKVDRITSTWSINQQVIQWTDQDVLYFDWRNVRRLSYEMNTLALKDSAISSEIAPLIDNLPLNQIQATSWFIYPYYKLFVKDRFSNTNNIWLVYNIREKSWSIQQWIFPSCWFSSYWIDWNKGYFASWVDWRIFSDNIWISFWWSDVNYIATSKKYAFGENLDFKRLWEVELYWEISSWFKMEVDVILDDVIIDTREIYFPNFISPTLWTSTTWVATFWWVETNIKNNKFRVRYEYFNDWVFLQLRFRWTWIWSFELHWMNVENKFVKAYPIHY